MGIENELSQAEIDAAEAAIFAADIAIEQAERFQNIRKIQVPVQAALKDPAAIFQKAQSP
jgi:fructose-specific phosphotransferase system component IIB